MSLPSQDGPINGGFSELGLPAEEPDPLEIDVYHVFTTMEIVFTTMEIDFFFFFLMEINLSL